MLGKNCIKKRKLVRYLITFFPATTIIFFCSVGYISAASRREAVSITMDSLENLHRSLASCPKETEKEPTPSCLTVPLLPHQERALKWLLWRETQVPAGLISFYYLINFNPR